MDKTLVVVESKGKIEKITKILGDDYKVVASCGHIIDLDKTGMGIDLETFTPRYAVTASSSTMSTLKKEYANCSDILLAADDDREGEMIAWSIAKELKLVNPKRIIFNSITEKELLHAVANPKKINMNFVNAQQTRRMLDKIVGFSISPLLWKAFGTVTLSAGRVQTVVLKLIVERELEIKNFVPESFIKVTAMFEHGIKAVLQDEIEGNAKQCKKLVGALVESTYTVTNKKTREGTKRPSAPFETATLQQEASNKLGYNAKRTMTIAQTLYEKGHITYMRTDSITLSNEALADIKKQVEKQFGTDYYNKNIYKTKSKCAQEAHEAVRPTHMNVRNVNLEGCEKLYDLIWKRTMASQMADAKTSVTDIDISDGEYTFAAVHEEIVFDGFLAVYEKEKNEKMYIPKKGEELDLESLSCGQQYTNPPTRYNDATLVSALKKLEIGRPATYASFIDKIQERKYVETGEVKGDPKDVFTIDWKENKITEKNSQTHLGASTGRFYPTSLGNQVCSFVCKNFPDITDYTFTAKMEDDLDKIANGDAKWKQVMTDFYDPFNDHVSAVKLTVKPGGDQEMKLLGVHPNGCNIYITTARYGDVVKMVITEKKCQYAPIRKPLTKESITLEDALELFEWPKDLGKYERKKVFLNRGANGYWVSVGITDKKKYSIDTDVHDIEEFDLDDAIEVVKENLAKIKWSKTDNGFDYKVLKGDKGLYLVVNKSKSKAKGKFFSLGDKFNEENIEELTMDDVKTIMTKKKVYKPKFKKGKVVDEKVGEKKTTAKKIKKGIKKAQTNISIYNI